CRSSQSCGRRRRRGTLSRRRPANIRARDAYVPGCSVQRNEEARSRRADPSHDRLAFASRTVQFSGLRSRDHPAMPASKRREVITGEQEAASFIRDGMTVSVGGFLNSSHPMPIIRALIRNGVKGLTVVGAASAGLEIDLLIGAGCVKTVIAPMISGESLAPI